MSSGLNVSVLSSSVFILVLAIASLRVSAEDSLVSFIEENYRIKPSVVIEKLEALSAKDYQSFSPTILVKASYAAATAANIDLAIELTEILLEKGKILNDDLLVGQAHYNRGAAYAYAGKHDYALDSLLLSLFSFENTDSEKDIARIKGGLALIYVEIGEYDLALPYFEEALESHKARDDKTNLALVLQNRGFMNIQLKNYDDAKRDLLQALTYSKELNHGSNFPVLYKNLGVIETELNNAEQAFNYFELAIQESNKNNLLHHQSEVLREFARLDFKLKNAEKAKRKLIRSIEIGKQFDLLKQIRNSYVLLSEVEASLGNYKGAFDASESASKTSELMGESRIAGNLSRLERYTTRIKEQNKRLVLEQEKKIVTLAAEREQLLKNFSFAVAGIAVLLAIYFVRRMTYSDRQAVHYEKQSKIDALTGVWNRRAGEAQLTRLCARDAKSVKVFSIAMLDIDNFKQVNDKYGHDVGDQVIIAICNLIQEGLRPADMLCRWGGEEFIIIWDNFSSAKAFDICERIRKKIAEESIHPIGQLTVSIGISMYEQDGVYELIKRGDQALYKAKHYGRNQVVIKNKSTEQAETEKSVVTMS